VSSPRSPGGQPVGRSACRSTGPSPRWFSAFSIGPRPGPTPSGGAMTSGRGRC